MFKINPRSFLLFGLVCLLATDVLMAQETTKKEETVEVALAGGKFRMQAPKSWNKVEPKFNMIEAEFSIPVSKDAAAGAKAGRLTIMAAGGSVDANIDRWIGQFSQPDGSSTGDQSTVDEIKVAGLTTHLVDITGTFAERSGGPVSPPTMRDNYRMLAAIIETEGPSYFIKYYGDEKTVEANAASFEKMVKSLVVK